MKKINKIRLVDRLLHFKQNAVNLSHLLLPILSVIVVITIIYQIGFEQAEEEGVYIFSIIYTIASIVFFFGYALRVFSNLVGKANAKSWLIPDVLLFVALLWVLTIRYFLEIDSRLFNIFYSVEFLQILFISIFFIETSKASLDLNKKDLDPPLIFAGSFLFLILIGTGLLLLPNSTVNGITMIDALFTSTSAVCVTGLIVVDTATHFTLFGQIVILVLFQTGALGVMTFTSFFGFFFRGSFSFENQIFIQDFINEDKISEIFRTLFKIIFFTLSVEFIGAILVYFLVDTSVIPDQWDKIFFSIFHSVSAFCNAGFSILSNGLYEEGVREMYHVHLVLAFIIILGGLGFPIIFNFFRYVKYIILSRYHLYSSNTPIVHKTRIINVNSKLALYTTTSLLIIGFVTFLIFENNHTLKGLSTYGKIVTAFFGAVTPRTAGFNTVDMGALSMSTVLIYLLLMWVGASPGSTGGGIKTTTFAVAILNSFSLGRAKDRVEAFRREINNESVRRAFAVMTLSFLVIGISVFLVKYFDPQLPLVNVAFECFSAFSTVGLSLGITGELSNPSRIVIIFTMFLGRVGTLTLMVGFLRNIRTLNYHYPSESIFIN